MGNVVINNRNRSNIVHNAIESNTRGSGRLLENRLGIPTGEVTVSQRPVISTEEDTSLLPDLSTLPDDIKKSIARMSAYDQEIAQIDEELTSALTDPRGYANLVGEARLNAARQIVGYKFRDLKDPNLTYDEFFSKFYKAYNSPTTTLEEKMAMDAAIESSPHKQQFYQDNLEQAKFMNFVKSTKAYRDLPSNDKKNMLVALRYLYQNQIPLNEEADIDTIFAALNLMPAESFNSALKAEEDFQGQYKALTHDQLAVSLKSIFNEVVETKSEIKERNTSHTDISAVDPNTESTEETKEAQPTPAEIDDSKVLTEMEETLEKAKQTNQEIVDETLPQASENVNQETKTENQQAQQGDSLPTNASFIDHYYAYRDQNKASRSIELTNSFFENLQAQIEQQKQQNPNITDQELDDFILDEITSIRIPDKKAAAKKIYNDIQATRRGETKKTDSANKQLDLEGVTPVGQKYLQDNSSKQTLSKSAVTNGTEVYFYDPKELAESNDPQVAVVVKDPNGSLEIKGQKYSVISTADRSEAMEKENPERKGDFLYSQKGKLTYVEKGAYGKDAKTTTNVRDIANKPGELTTSEIANRVSLSKGRVAKAGHSYSQYVVPLQRGRGTEKVEVELYVTDIASVKDSTGETFFDKLKKFVQTAFNSLDEKIENARAIRDFNFRTKKGVEVLQRGLNTLVDSMFESIEKERFPTPEMYTKQLSQIYNDLMGYLIVEAKTKYTFTISDISIIGASVAFTLNITDGEVTIPLHHMVCDPNDGVSIADALHILYSIAFDENGLLRKHTNEIGIEKSFLKWNVHYSDNPNPELIAKDIEAGMFEINHSTFAYSPARIGYAFVEESSSTTDSVQQQTSVETIADNTTPAQNIAAVETTIDGEPVNTDTGYSESTQQTETREEDTWKPAEDMYLDEDEVDEYQLVETRQSLIASIKEKLSSLLFDSAAKADYAEWIQSATQDYVKDTKNNAFSQTKKDSLKEARKQAEKRRKEILASKDPRIKSIRVVRSSPIGYSLQMDFYSYDEYVNNEMARLKTLDTGTLTGLKNRLFETASIIKVTQKQASERLSWLSQFKKGALYKAYKDLMGTRVDTEMEALVKSILKAYNFRVIEQALHQVHGKDVAGKLDTIGKIVYLAQSEHRNKLTSVEELAHVIVETILQGDSKEGSYMKAALESLMEEIKTTEFYKQTEKDYSKVENYNLKKEAVGKALATVIAMRSKASSSFIEKISLFLSDAIIFFKSLLERAGLTKGNDAIIQHKLNIIAKQLVEKKTNTANIFSVNDALQATDLSTTRKHSESKKIQQRKEKIAELQKASSARSINYDFLSEEVKAQLQAQKIDKATWNKFPFGLQDNILRCITKN